MLYEYPSRVEGWLNVIGKFMKFDFFFKFSSINVIMFVLLIDLWVTDWRTAFVRLRKAADGGTISVVLPVFLFRFPPSLVLAHVRLI